MINFFVRPLALFAQVWIGVFTYDLTPIKTSLGFYTASNKHFLYLLTSRISVLFFKMFTLWNNPTWQMNMISLEMNINILSEQGLQQIILSEGAERINPLMEGTNAKQ